MEENSKKYEWYFEVHSPLQIGQSIDVTVIANNYKDAIKELIALGLEAAKTMCLLKSVTPCSNHLILDPDDL